MRNRIARSLFAVAAAGVTATTLGFAAAGAASASPVINSPSGGTPVYTNTNCTSGTCAVAGYQASGRDFRYVQAVIKVPTSDGSTATSPELYVGLHDGNLSNTNYPNAYAHAGIEPCTIGFNCPNGWEGFYEVFQDGSPFIFVTVPFDGVVAGDGVFFSIYFNSVGNADRFVVTLPDGTTSGQTVAVNGPVYTSAVATADWGFTTAPDPDPAVPPANTRVTQFLQGRFTTLSGQQGTFNGPWSLNPVEATTNGFAPSSGTLVAAPAFLWTDANSFKGMSGDAFGVWLYHP
jgi:hypothetical protein